jgi:hypothetical protein
MTYINSLLKPISESSAFVYFLLLLLLNFNQLAAVAVLQQVPYFMPPLLNFLKFVYNTKKVQGSNDNSMEKPKITYNTSLKVYFLSCVSYVYL